MLIAQGRVTVDGAPASTGDRIDATTAVVRIDGVILPLSPDLTTWLIYKPAGIVTTMEDPQGRPTVTSLVPADPITRPVGRLDLHSEGLMLMTNDGDLALVVTHPRYQVPKTYQVLVPRRVTDSALAPLTAGVDLDDGPARAASARVVTSSADRTIVELVLTEGRKREIRRMFQVIDLPIERLVRTAIGPIADRSIAPGDHRKLTDAEIRSLYRYAKDVEIHD
ncbi:MAG TPA: pseudouridine synthase [Acidimicrobiia bacterium]|nr:pseudouridine synthase [Acidimicrobiia bacterium]